MPNSAQRQQLVNQITQREQRRSPGFMIGTVTANSDGLLQVGVRGRANPRQSVAQVFDDQNPGDPAIILASDRGTSMDMSFGFSPWLGPGLTA